MINAYKLDMTEEEIENFKKDFCAKDETPLSYINKRVHNLNRELIGEIERKGYNGKSVALDADMTIAYIHKENLGTKKYCNMCDIVYVSKIKSINATVKTCYGHLVKDKQILGILRD